MGRTVAHWFHLNHEVFIGHCLRKNRSDPAFSVQKLSDGNMYGCQPTEFAGIFLYEEVWRLHSVIAENNFLKEKSQLLPNHHIVHFSRYSIPELESQLLPNGSIWDDLQDTWVELESQLLPNRHIMYMARYNTLELESQLLPNWWYKVCVSPNILLELESQLLPKHLLTEKMVFSLQGEISATIKSSCKKCISRGWMHSLASTNGSQHFSTLHANSSGLILNVLNLPLDMNWKMTWGHRQALSMRNFLLRKLDSILLNFQTHEASDRVCLCDLITVIPALKYPLLHC